MAKKKREVPEINSSSTADIAFLLLIFFLITTSMDTDRGLARRLPPPPEKDQKLDDAKKKERNVLQVFLNMQDQLMCGNDYITVDQLRAKAKEFIANPYNEDTKPEKISKNVPFFGTVQVTEGHVISLRCDRGSSYKAYMSVQNELVAAYNELRDELAQEKWQKNYMELDQEQQDAIREIYSQSIAFTLTDLSGKVNTGQEGGHQGSGGIPPAGPAIQVIIAHIGHNGGGRNNGGEISAGHGDLTKGLTSYHPVLGAFYAPGDHDTNDGQANHERNCDR